MRIRSKLIITLLIISLLPLVALEVLTVEIIKEEAGAVSQQLIDQLYSLSGLLTLFFVMFILLSGLVVSNSITKPLEKLTAVMDDISQGKLDTSIDPKLKGSDDEIGALAGAFDRTLVSLKLAMRQSAPELNTRLEKGPRHRRD